MAGYEKNPDELGTIFVSPGQEGTAYAENEYFSGKTFDIPEGVPVVFVAGSYIAKKGKRMGQECKFYRVLLAPPPEADLNEDGTEKAPF